MLTFKLIKNIALRWAEDSVEYKKLKDIRKQIIELFESFAASKLTDEEKEYIKKGYPYVTLDRIPLLNIDEFDMEDGASNSYIVKQVPLVKSINKTSWSYFYDTKSALHCPCGYYYGSKNNYDIIIYSLPLPNILPDTIFFYGLDNEDFNKFAEENEEFMKSWAKLLVDHEMIQRKLLSKAKLILDELKTLNLTDLKKYYKELYNYAKKA